MRIEKFKSLYLSSLIDSRRFVHSLAIKYKLSAVIVLIVIAVVGAFSIPILIRQKQIYTEKVNEIGHMLAGHLVQDVKNILLCKVTDECMPTGSVQEQLELMLNGNYKEFSYAFVLDRDSLSLVRPESATQEVQARRETYLKLLSVTSPTSLVLSETIEYYHPVMTKPNSEGRQAILGVVGVGLSKDAVDAPIDAARSIIYLVGALVIIVAVWGILMLAGRLVTRITELSSAARQVGLGNLQVEVDGRSRDELGQLAREFNRMVSHIREKLHMQKFVSKLTVQMIRERNGGRLQPTRHGQKQQIAILFSDIRNFTRITETLSAEDVVQLINDYFHLQTVHIETHGGIVDKFMGDSIMAIFPAKRMLDNAVSAAVAIQRDIRELNRRRNGAKQPVVEVGIGVNCGAAILGNMGSKHRMDYTVIGDVVNIASRLCSIAKAGQIISTIGDDGALNGKYPKNMLQPIIVKGRTRPIQICEINYQFEDTVD